MTMRTTLLIISFLTITGCNGSQFYQAAKQYQINECNKSASNAEYNDCIKTTDETRNEYNKKREELLIK